MYVMIKRPPSPREIAHFRERTGLAAINESLRGTGFAVVEQRGWSDDVVLQVFGDMLESADLGNSRAVAADLIKMADERRERPRPPSRANAPESYQRKPKQRARKAASRKQVKAKSRTKASSQPVPKPVVRPALNPARAQAAAKARDYVYSKVMVEYRKGGPTEVPKLGE